MLRPSLWKRSRGVSVCGIESPAVAGLHHVANEVTRWIVECVGARQRDPAHTQLITTRKPVAMRISRAIKAAP